MTKLINMQINTKKLWEYVLKVVKVGHVLRNYEKLAESVKKFA